MSDVIQTFISMCHFSTLGLHGRGVIAWLHCLCPKLKLPKALALVCWINHLYFFHTTANHLWVCLTLPPLIIQIERSKAFFSCLALPLALINGAPLTENYIGDVTLKRGEEKERLHLNERAQPSLCFAADVQLREWSWSSFYLTAPHCRFCVTAHSPLSSAILMLLE